MIRKIFKKGTTSSKLDAIITKYKIPKEFLMVNRKSITKGLFIGLFIGFIPMPFQMVAVMAVMPFAKFNVPIAISMVWLSNPITMPFMYYMEYVTGSHLLGMQMESVELTLEWFETNLSRIFIPLYVGTLFYSVIVSTLVYYGVDWLWIRSVRNARKRVMLSPKIPFEK